MAADDVAKTVKGVMEEMVEKYGKEKAKDIGKGSFEAGIKGMARGAWDNIKETAWDGQYIEGAVKGALGFGAVGGLTEWSQGGSFWSGASSGVVNGAILGAGARATKVGAYGTGWEDGAWRNVPKTYKEGYTSKALEAIWKNEAGVKEAMKNMGKS